MRKFTYLAAILLCAGLLSSCQDDPGEGNELTFKGVDLRNAKALALVHETKGSANAPLKARADGDELVEDGIAYVMGNDQQAFYICDLSKSEAERVTIDGYETTIVLPVMGENKGKVRIYKAGDTTAGTVISVMVRLN